MGDLNYGLLVELINDVPDGLNRDGKKELIPEKVRMEIQKRDKSQCQICYRKYEYFSNNRVSGKLVIHHKIPNTSTTPTELITLCKSCHKAVHILLNRAGKWKPFYQPPSSRNAGYY